MVREFPTPKQNDKFLWVRCSKGLGDVLQGLSDLYYIKQRFPYITTGFLTVEKYIQLAQSQPYVDEVLVGAKSPISAMFQTAKLMKEKQYDWVASTYKGGHMPVMAYLSGIKNRLGNTGYWSFLQTANVFDWAKFHEIDLLQRTEKSLFATEESTKFAKKLLKPLEGKKKLFCVISAGTSDKRWPLEYWVEFLKPLANEGWGIVLNGYGANEEEMAKTIQAGVKSENILSIVSKINYYTLIGVINECHAAVGNDSGPLHAAMLCKLPTVGLFDYIPPIEVGFNARWMAKVLAVDENLQTFYSKRRNECMLAKITPQIVENALNQLLRENSL